MSKDSPAEVLQPAPIFDEASAFVEDCMDSSQSCAFVTSSHSIFDIPDHMPRRASEF